MNWITTISVDALGTLSGAMAGAGFGGVVALGLMFAFGSLVLAPRPVLSYLAGLSYGFAGLPLALLSALVGAALAFWISRRFARPLVARYAAERPALLAITRAVDHEGWRAVLLLRLGPIVPSSLQSYVFGASRVAVGPYLLATLVGIAPGVMVQVSAGALSRSVLAGPLQSWNPVLLGLGLAASATAVVLIGRRARALMHGDRQTSEPRSGAV